MLGTSARVSGASNCIVPRASCRNCDSLRLQHTRVSNKASKCANMMSFSGNKGAIWAAWPLSTCGFAILLGGVASMQNDCSANINVLTLGGVGTPGYLAPVSCGHFFQYTWWITFLHFFTWVMVLAYLVMDVIHKNRAALVGILAVAAVLLMDTANTYLQYNYLPGLTGTMLTRARVTVAGAIIAAVADLLLILLVGWHDDKTTYKERGETTGTGAGYAAGNTVYTTVPVSSEPARTTTTATEPTTNV